MTQDHLDDFTAACEREKVGYLVAIHNGHKGVHVRTDFNHWPQSALRGKEHDCMLAIAAALGTDIGKVTVLVDAERQAVLGALDTLGTLLAEAGHVWTAGERAIYEEATRLLGAQAEPPEGQP